MLTGRASGSQLEVREVDLISSYLAVANCVSPCLRFDATMLLLEGNTMITMNPSGWAGTGSESVCKTGIIIGYEVVGLPPTDRAYIANDGWNQEHWQTLRVKDGISSSWMGDFA